MKNRRLLMRARRRIRARLDRYRPDVEIRQLWDLVDRYNQANPPDVLLIGDSAMYWVAEDDADQRNLAQVITDEFDGDVRVHAIAGPGYNARMARVFLEALSGCRHRPKLVILPATLAVAAEHMHQHPFWSYQRESSGLREILRAGDRSAKRLPRGTEDDWEKYDALPAASLFGARRTQGELRLVTHGLPDPKHRQPTTRWLQVVRLRHVLDSHNGETLTPDSVGVRMIAEMAGSAADLGLQVVAYIPPVNVDLVRKVFKQPGLDHIARNAEVVSNAIEQATHGTGRVVNAVFACPEKDFGDALHLSIEGRKDFGTLIIREIREMTQ
jgi:hypothetical protein